MTPAASAATVAAGDWYLIFTRPRQERTALINIERQGYGAFLPLMRSQKRCQGSRLADVIEPMFPRYLFVRLNSTTDNWRPIHSTRGVSTLVRFGMDPARVPGDLVELLRGQGDEKGIRSISRPAPKPGDRVRIGAGPFEGFEGILHARSGKERVILLLEIASQNARVELDEKDIDGA
ncbi:MAG: transcription/translation regulatory transformer protein RfaH [Rhodocyclaceae bacterium]|nr:transcription/translation regulatory transformer protein RfaH [Rhodocyclaceae bacterium]